MDPKKAPGNYYFITTILQVPRDFRNMDPSTYLKEYIDSYCNLAGEYFTADYDKFSKYVHDNLRLLSPKFNQNILRFRNPSFTQDPNKVIVLSSIILGRNIKVLSAQIAEAFCSEFIKVDYVFASGIVVERV